VKKQIINLFSELFDNLNFSLMLIRNPLQASNVGALNYGASIALLKKSKYFFRSNDDTVFLDPSWLRMLVDRLDKNACLGVAGPLHSNGNIDIFTMDMVCDVHFRIFGYWYDPAFLNWWSDDFISDVYPPKHVYPTMALVEHQVMPTRYKVAHISNSDYMVIVLRNRHKLSVYLASNFSKEPLGRQAIAQFKRKQKAV